MVTVFLGTDVNIFLSARAQAPIHSSPPYVAGETRGNWDTRVSMRLADGVTWMKLGSNRIFMLIFLSKDIFYQLRN